MSKNRLFIPDGQYHIFNTGNNGQIIFYTDKDRYVFLKMLKSAVIKYRIEIIAYCLMSNHIHLEIIDNGINISNVMRDIQSGYTSYFNLNYKMKGHLFQGPYQYSIIYDLKGLFRVLRYISRNPFKAGMVTDPFEYFWSGVSYENDIYNLINYDILFEMYSEIHNINYFDFIRKEDDDLLLAEVELYLMHDEDAKLIYEKIIDSSGVCINHANASLNDIEKVINACRYHNLTKKQIALYSGLSYFKIDSIKKNKKIYI